MKRKHSGLKSKLAWAYKKKKKKILSLGKKRSESKKQQKLTLQMPAEELWWTWENPV